MKCYYPHFAKPGTLPANFSDTNARVIEQRNFHQQSFIFSSLLSCSLAAFKLKSNGLTKRKLHSYFVLTSFADQTKRFFEIV